MATQIGDGNLVFGITAEAWGYVTNLKHAAAVEVAEAMDGDGDVVNVETHGARVEVSFTYTFRTTTAQNSGEPSQQIGTGTGITLTDSPNFPNTIWQDTGNGANLIIVKSVTETRSNTGFKEIEVEGTHWPNLSV